MIAGFYKENGYLPTQHTPPSGEHKRLALALQRFRRLKAAGDLHDDAVRILDQAHPGWTARSDHATELWHSRADEFIAWVWQHGRFPQPSAEDPAERFLSTWLHRQRQDARRERFPARVKELDSRLPEWRETFSDQDRQSYVESAQQIAAYVQQTGSLPASDGQSGSETERLAGVLIVLRNQKRRGLLAKEATQALDAAFPGWLDGVTLNVERHWQSRATEFIEWVKENGRHPHRSAWDPKERALAGWVARQRVHAKKRQYPHRIRELNARLPEWNCPS
ncbi:helicase associated domain-containing protein [Paenarthrobacter ilicis]|uniref:helicase associated domain-containing protein n=1 Tax=Paenarthrobacter ilicis TaxID=43665 RepID=UPI0028D908D6|nr:helicase associated domain-containing protein [Paenarthrobacter ilicis]